MISRFPRIIELTRSKKGASGIIGGLFIVIVSMMIFSMSYWQIMQQDHYNEIILGRARRDWERYNERILISEIRQGSYLQFKVRNIGGVAAHIMTIYLNDTAVNIPGAFDLANYICPNSSAWINPGAEKLICTTIPFAPDHIYDLKLATERGNIAAEVYSPADAPLPPGTFRFGSLPFQFESTSFNYTTTSDETYWRSNSRPAWEMTGGKANILFWVKVTNHGSQTIEISRLSYLMVVRPASDTTEDEFYFHIVNNASISGDVTAYQDYSQSIPCNLQDPEAGGLQTIVKFGATQPGGTTLRSMPSPVSGYSSERKYLYTSYLVIFWRWSGTTQYYGLVVPFAAIHVLSS